MREEIKIILVITFLIILLGTGIIVWVTISDGNELSSFSSIITDKSDLKTAAEIDYENYISTDVEDVKDGYTNEWILNHWYYGFEPKTVISEEVKKPKIKKGSEAEDTLDWIKKYTKSLLKVEELDTTFMNYIDAYTGCYKFRDGNREYLVCCSVTKETGKKKVTVFHSEVIRNEAE